LISFLRGQLINHGTPPLSAVTQSKPIAPFLETEFSKYILNEIRLLNCSPFLSTYLQLQIGQPKEDGPGRHSLSSSGSRKIKLWSPGFLSQQPKSERMLEMADEIPFGQIAWNDLTVPDAEPVREFYESVVGWGASPVTMDGYSDYSMTDA